MDMMKVLRDKNGYSFKTPQSMNGVLKCKESVLESNMTYTTSEIPIIELYERKQVISHIHETREGISPITIDEYYNHIGNIERRKVVDEHGNRSYATLEDEYEYKCFVRDYEPVKTTKLVFVKNVELNIVNYIEPPNEFIIPFRHLGGDVTSIKATYKRQACLIFHIKKILNENGYADEEDKNSVSKLRYKIYTYRQGMVNISINKTQVIDMTVSDISDDINVVMKNMEDDVALVKLKIQTYLGSISITQLNLSNVINNFKNIRNMVIMFDIKRKSMKERQDCLATINKYITEYEELSIKEYERDAKTRS